MIKMVDLSHDSEFDYNDKDPFGMGVKLPPGLLTLEDEETLRKYSADAKLVINLGTGGGRSAKILSMFAQKVITVDFHPYDFLVGHPDIRAIVGCSWEVEGELPDDSADLVFFDADHSEEGVLREFNHWLPKLRNGGVVIFHDYKYQTGVNPLLAVRPMVNHIVGTGQVRVLETPGWCLVGRVNKDVGDLLYNPDDPFRRGIKLPVGNLTLEDQYLLKKYATGKRLCLDIGTFRGRSACIMSLFAERVVTVDNYVWPAEHGIGMTAEEWYRITVKDLSRFKNVSFVMGDAEKAAEIPEVLGGFTDLVFIDNGHQCVEVLRDFTAWRLHMTPGAMVIFHDYTNPEKRTQDWVREAVRELIRTGKVEPVEIFGWCYVGKII